MAITIGVLKAEGRFDSPNCSVGNKPCGNTCIPQKYHCRIKGGKGKKLRKPSASRMAKIFNAGNPKRAAIAAGLTVAGLGGLALVARAREGRKELGGKISAGVKNRASDLKDPAAAKRRREEFERFENELAKKAEVNRAKTPEELLDRHGKSGSKPLDPYKDPEEFKRRLEDPNDVWEL